MEIKVLEILLCFIALLVFILLLVNHAAPWIVIACYWGVLTAKNFLGTASKM